MTGEDGHRECARIFEEWHRFAKDRNLDALVDLYADDAVLESPLVPAILDDAQTGVLEGKAAIRRFLEEGGRRRPNDLVRWFRTGRYLTDGQLLMWEYPRCTPDGDQIDILEVMEVADGHIRKHRIYWGWKGCMQIADSLVGERA